MSPLDLFPVPHDVLAPKAWHAPAVFDSPHSGSLYPQAFRDQSRLDASALRKSEDCYIDALFAPVVDYGAPLLRMQVPRAYIDVNREPYELDARMFADELPAFANCASVRVVGGLGTIPRIVSEGENARRGALRWSARTRLRALNCCCFAGQRLKRKITPSGPAWASQ